MGDGGVGGGRWRCGEVGDGGVGEVGDGGVGGGIWRCGRWDMEVWEVEM